MMRPVVLAAILLLLPPGLPAANNNQTHFTVLVTNSVTMTPNKTYSTYVVFRGILLGGLRRLQDANTGFSFTYREDPNYGPFLESVNGLAGNTTAGTYWELLVKKANRTVIRPDVGIGCYIPSADDEVILKYTY